MRNNRQTALRFRGLHYVGLRRSFRSLYPLHKLIPNHRQALGEWDLTSMPLRMKQVRLHTLLLHLSASFRRLLR